MKRFFIYLFLVIGLLLFLSRSVLFRMRWSDSKAYRVFKSKNVRLAIHDTLIGNRHIHYAVAGKDGLPSLVFIHGSPGSWFHYYRFMCDTDLIKKYRIISIDRPGFGQSDYGEAMHLDKQARLITPVLQSLGPQPIILCGHSLGGPLVARIAADVPGLIDKLVIIAGSLDPALEEKETWRHVVNVKPLYWFMPGVFQTSNTELLYLKNDLNPLAGDLSKITCPVLFVHGDNDKWVPIGNIAYGQRMMINAKSLHADTLRGAGHNFPWTRREEFKRILMDLDKK